MGITWRRFGKLYPDLQTSGNSFKQTKIGHHSTLGFSYQKCEEFHKLEHQLQIDSLHNFLLQCASRISEPTEAIESDPQDNEKTPFSLDE